MGQEPERRPRRPGRKGAGAQLGRCGPRGPGTRPDVWRLLQASRPRPAANPDSSTAAGKATVKRVRDPSGRLPAGDTPQAKKPREEAHSVRQRLGNGAAVTRRSPSTRPPRGERRATPRAGKDQGASDPSGAAQVTTTGWAPALLPTDKGDFPCYLFTHICV